MILTESQMIRLQLKRLLMLIIANIMKRKRNRKVRERLDLRAL